MIIPVAAIKEIFSGIAVKLVIAVFTVQIIVTGIADQSIVTLFTKKVVVADIADDGVITGTGIQYTALGLGIKPVITSSAVLQYGFDIVGR